MPNKKGVAIAMNIIVIAAIALVVLVVLLAIFTGRINLFGKGVESSERAAYATLCDDPLKTDMEYACTQQDLAAEKGQDWVEKRIPYGKSWSDCQYICWQRSIE